MTSVFPLTEAELVGLFMECIVFGIYLVTLFATARVLLWDPVGRRKKCNWPMVIVMCLMAVFATMDVAMGLKRNLDAFVLFKGPGGAEQDFADMSNWASVMKTVDTQVMALIGDGMLIYRCFVIYSRRWLAITVPSIIWLGNLACSILIIWITATHDTTITAQSLLKTLIYVFLCVTIGLNTITNAMIIRRIWRINKQNAEYIVQPLHHRPSIYLPRTHLENIMRIVIESGLLYSFTVIITFVCVLAGSNAVYPVSDVMVVGVGICFNLIIIRVDNASSNSVTELVSPLQARMSRADAVTIPLQRIQSDVAPYTTPGTLEVTLTSGLPLRSSSSDSKWRNTS